MCKICEESPKSFSRRSLIFSAPCTLAATSLLGRSAFCEKSHPISPSQNAISPEAALERLIKGNKRYSTNASEQKDFSSGRAARVLAQYPVAAILSCSDSRVSPEIIFDQGLGDLFVVRLAGNFVDDDGLASLEYAVDFLNVPLVFVLGHSNCGAVSAAIKVVKEKATLPGNLPELINSIKPAVLKAQQQKPDDLLSATIEENVKLNVQRLYNDEPILSKALKNKTIAAVGGIYDLATGTVRLVT